MTGSPNLLITIFAFLLVLGPLVLIHELGHYLVGRLFGVKANAFSIGFGKELAGWTDKRGTRWKLSALPLGGYVQFAGDMNPASAPSTREDGLTPAERAQTFHVKPLWQRALIVLAGPLTNFLLCVAILAGFAYAHGRVVIDPEVAAFAEQSAARDAGMQVGDRIVAVDGKPLESADALEREAAFNPGETMALTVDRGGEELTLTVTAARRELSDQFGNTGVVGDLGIDFAVPIINGFAEDSPAQAAGMQEGDRIIAIGDTAISSFGELQDQVRPSAGQTLDFTVMRDGEAHVVPVTVTEVRLPDENTGKERAVGVIGVASGYGRLIEVGAGEAVTLGFTRSFEIMGTMVSGIRQIFTGQRSVKELGGPIKIAQYSGQSFSLGWQQFVSFAAMISINLAFINLLPIPGLDGGHLAFYAAEFVRRKPLGARSQEWAIRTGVALVLALMLFVTVNDLASLPIFGG